MRSPWTLAACLGAIGWTACGGSGGSNAPGAQDGGETRDAELSDVGSPVDVSAGDGADVGDGASPGEAGGSSGGGEAGGPAQMASSLTQYGITWTFDHAYPYGTYANGDYWVEGPVTITSITPSYGPFAFQGGMARIHGWQVNPASSTAQGLDERAQGFDATLVPSLPYKAAPGSSIVKGYSWDDTVNDCTATNGQMPCSFPDGTGIDCKGGPGGSNGPCLYTAAVLTVVASPPPNGGATSFRPAYFGTTKTSYTTTALSMSVLPSLAPPSGQTPPTVASLVARFQRPQIDYQTGWTVEFMHPYKNMDYPGNVTGYPGNYGTDVSEAILRSMLNDLSASDRQSVVVTLVQAGIDYYASAVGGVSWPANGGHGNGRKLPIAFAAALLGDAAIASFVSNVPNNTFGEDGDISLNSAGEPVFGEPPVAGCDEQSYWNQLVYDGNGTGGKDCRDPYGFIDGGYEPGNGYDACCNDMPWKGEALVGQLMSPIKTTWNGSMFYDYVDRWVSSGVLTLPDPCAGPPSGSADQAWMQYGVSYGPDPAHPGQCIQNGTGRFPSLQGTDADQGYYGSDFNDAMWATYRPQVQPPAGDGG